MVKQFWKILVTCALSLYMAASMAAVDVNRASAAELDAIKGIGPGTSARIIEARKAGEFKNWDDFISRVKGVGHKNAQHFADSGLTVNGVGANGIPAEKTSMAKPEKMAKDKTTKTVTAAPAATKAPEKAHEKAPEKAATKTMEKTSMKAPAADTAKDAKKADKEATKMAKAAKAEAKTKAPAEKAAAGH